MTGVAARAFPDHRPASDETQRARAAAVTSIARLAQMTGTTPRALRHYQQEGLLAPYRTRTGQRRYSPADVERALTIVWLRRLDLSLAEIRDLLDAAGARDARDGLRRRLLERIDALERDRRLTDRALAALDVEPDAPFDVRALREAVVAASPPRLEAVPRPQRFEGDGRSR